MGFYIRRSIRIGKGLRLNLSRRGVGVSAGIKGLRVGLNRRGTYVQMGAGGVYYRQQLTHAHPKHPHPAAPSPRSRSSPSLGGPMDQDLLRLPPQSGEIPDAAFLRHFQSTPWIALLLVAAAIVILAVIVPPGLGVCIGPLGVGGLAACLYSRRGGQLVYALEGEPAAAYESFVSAFRGVFASKATWLCPVHQAQPASGLGSELVIVKRSRAWATVRKRAFRANIAVPCLITLRDALVFLPDVLIVRHRGQVRAYSYSDVQVTTETINLPEQWSVPSDSEIVRRVYAHARKDGCPDRRYRDNPSRPVCRYQLVRFSVGSIERVVCKSLVTDVTPLVTAVGKLATAHVATPVEAG